MTWRCQFSVNCKTWGSRQVSSFLGSQMRAQKWHSLVYIPSEHFFGVSVCGKPEACLLAKAPVQADRPFSQEVWGCILVLSILQNVWLLLFCLKVSKLPDFGHFSESHISKSSCIYEIKCVFLLLISLCQFNY